MISDNKNLYKELEDEMEQIKVHSYVARDGVKLCKKVVEYLSAKGEPWQRTLEVYQKTLGDDTELQSAWQLINDKETELVEEVAECVNQGNIDLDCVSILSKIEKQVQLENVILKSTKLIIYKLLEKKEEEFGLEQAYIN